MVEKINALIKEELKRSQDLYEEYFPRTQYAYGVILEELEETEDGLKTCKYLLDTVWSCMRDRVSTAKEFEKDTIGQLAEESRLLIEEAVQLAAMADKLLQGIDEGITVVD